MAISNKILMINPDWTGIGRQKQPQFKRIWQPLGLAIAAALLEKEGFFVKIIDNNISRLSPLEIGKFSAGFDKVFVTSTPYDRWQCPSLDIKFFFDAIEHILPEKLYIMGAHVTERPETILKKSRARAAVLHEPEQTILEIARRDVSRQMPPDIRGIAYIKDNRLVRTSSMGYLNDLDNLPYPAFHLLDMGKYFYEFMGENFTVMEGSRGCPFQCSFCYLGMYGTRFRQKSIKRLVDETVYVTNRFNIKNIYFMDLEFGLNRRRLLLFCEELTRQKLDIKWCCQTRVTDVDGKALQKMKESGCTLIHFGVEAGVDRILSRTGKKITIADCKKAVSLARDTGIRTALFMNFGFPGETKEDMEATIDLAVRLNPTYAAFHMIVPFPGTRLAEQIGLDPEAFPPDQYPHYNFACHDLKLLKSMLKKAYLKFYLRPLYLAGFAKRFSMSGFKQAKLFFRMFFK